MTTIDQAQENLTEAARIYTELIDAQGGDGDAVMAGAVLVYEMARVDRDGDPAHGPGYVLLSGTPLQGLGALIMGRRYLEAELDDEEGE